MDDDDFQDVELSVSEMNRVMVAALSGRPDPIGSDASAKLYASVEVEKAENPGASWEIPGEF